jgi:hypothetical protein
MRIVGIVDFLLTQRLTRNSGQVEWTFVLIHARDGLDDSFVIQNYARPVDDIASDTAHCRGSVSVDSGILLTNRRDRDEIKIKLREFIVKGKRAGEMRGEARMKDYPVWPPAREGPPRARQ